MKFYILGAAAAFFRPYRGRYHTATRASPQTTSMTECCLVKTVEMQMSAAQP